MGRRPRPRAAVAGASPLCGLAAPRRRPCSSTPGSPSFRPPARPRVHLGVVLAAAGGSPRSPPGARGRGVHGRVLPSTSRRVRRRGPGRPPLGGRSPHAGRARLEARSPAMRAAADVGLIAALPAAWGIFVEPTRLVLERAVVDSAHVHVPSARRIRRATADLGDRVDVSTARLACSWPRGRTSSSSPATSSRAARSSSRRRATTCGRCSTAGAPLTAFLRPRQHDSLACDALLQLSLNRAPACAGYGQRGFACRSATGPCACSGWRTPAPSTRCCASSRPFTPCGRPAQPFLRLKSDCPIRALRRSAARHGVTSTTLHKAALGCKSQRDRSGRAGIHGSTRFRTVPPCTRALWAVIAA